MSKVQIIYGTTGGNTEIVVDKISEVLSEKAEVIVTRAEEFDINDINKSDLLILASPTYGHGILQREMIPFYNKLIMQDLKGQKSAVVGLGDSKYEINYMFKSAQILEEALEKINAKLVCPSLKINASPIPFLDNRVKLWAQGLFDHL